MRRVRQTSPGLPQAAIARLGVAVALSVAAHFFLIYGFSLPTHPGPGAVMSVIQARLAPPSPIVSSPPKSPERNGSPVPARSAGVALPEPAPSDSPDPQAAPDPTDVRSDPEPVAAAEREAPRLNLPDPVHYPARDLDVFPQALRPLAPAYPDAARDARVSGFVTLQVLIDESGRVVGTTVVDAAPSGVFEQAAQDALANAAFYPARKDGRTVRSRILVKVEFDPAGLER